MMKASLMFIVSRIGAIGIPKTARQIARDHSSCRHDIQPALYDDWLESLIETARKYDPLFDYGSEPSWRLAKSLRIAYTKIQYDG
jgi:hypothetical protein